MTAEAEVTAPRRGSASTSLRLRLLAMLLGATGLVWLAAAWWSYIDARHEAEELLDAQLAQSARLLLAQTRHELVEGEGHLSAFDSLDKQDLHPYEQKLQFRIEDASGRTVLASSNPPPPSEGSAAGYADVYVDGEGWRVLVARMPNAPLHVEVAQSLAIRDELARYIALRLMLPISLGLPLLGALIFVVVGRAMRPLLELAGNVSARTAENLTPVCTEGLPSEVQPLTTALNSLLDRLKSALDRERRITADAAHELRTPLAAIQMQAQVALASGAEQARRHALQQVVCATARATHLVEQLLRLARLDPLTGLQQVRHVELADLARQGVDDALSAADAERVRLVDTAPGAGVEGDAELLRVAVRNLVDNALRYSPPAGEVTVSIGRHEDGLRLSVADCGPGVPEEELPRLTERFFRGQNVTGEGSGLGLAIVRRIAELHGARLELRNRPGGGLQATLAW